MGMDCYLRWSEDYYTDELKDNAKTTFTECRHYDSHNTSNKIMMASSARVLASIEWPNATFASGFNKGDANSTGGIRFADACQKYVQRGEDEYNSPTYYAFHYGPMRTVADFAPDSLITESNGEAYNFKKIASLTAEWMLASSATEWMEGHWVASTARLTINQSRPQHQYVMGDLVMRLYLGGIYGGDKDGNFEKFRAYGSIIPAVSAYRVPTLYQDIANHREEEGYSAYERKLLEFGIYKVNYYLTSFRMPEYGIYSSYEVSESLNDDPRFTFEEQQIRWGVAWKDSTSNNSVFVLKHELDPSDSLTPGLSQYEHVSQYEGTLVGVYNIPEDDTIPHIKGYIPTAYDAYIDNSDSGQIYLKYNDLLMGVYLSEPFKWNKGDATFLKDASQLAFVIETARASNYSGTHQQKLAAFQQAVQPNLLASRFSVDTSGTPSMEYTSADGTTIETKYRTHTKINNVLVDYRARKLINNPWMQQDYDSTSLTVNYNGAYKNYDFANFTTDTNITEPPADPKPPLADDGTIIINAQGDCGVERMELRIDSTAVEEWTVSTTPADYQYQGFAGGEVSVHFLNDSFGNGDVCDDNNLTVNYINVCGTTYQTETTATKSEGCCPWDKVKLFNEGYFNFGMLNCSSEASATQTDRLVSHDAFRSYPNPATEQLTVEGGKDYQVSLYDLAGRPVMRHDHLTGRTQLNISHLRPGVYLMKVLGAQPREVSRRIIIE